MAGAVITKAINDLKANADKLNPKPSADFDKFCKANSTDVIDAAKSIDAAIFRKNVSAAQTALKSFNSDASKFCGDLTTAANKEAPAVKGKLTGIIGAAKKKMADTTKSEVDAFVKEMAGQTRSVDQAKAAIEKQIEVRERGTKEAQKLLGEAKKALNDVIVNRKKGGGDTLEDSQKILHHLRLAESELDNKGAFHDSQKPLAGEHAKTLDNGSLPKAEVAKLRKESEDAHKAGLDLMATARDVRQKVYVQVIEHHEEVEKAAALAAKNDRSQAGQSKQLEADFNKFHVETRDVLDKTDKSAWGDLKKLNEPGKEKEYQRRVQETEAAFKELPALRTSLTKRRNAVEELQDKVAKEQDASKELTGSIAKLLTKTSNLKRLIDSAFAVESTFKHLKEECDQDRKKRGSVA